LLDTIPGIDRRAAEMLLAEIGPDMSRFPTEAHLASWGGMCPSQRESAGKNHSAATRKGSKWLRGTVTESAKAVVRTKGTYLSARYQRIKSRRGHAKPRSPPPTRSSPPPTTSSSAASPTTSSAKRSSTARDTEHTERYRRRLIHQLERLGHEVTLEPLAEAACAPASFRFSRRLAGARRSGPRPSLSQAAGFGGAPRRSWARSVRPLAEDIAGRLGPRRLRSGFCHSPGTRMRSAAP
jgi:transposase